MWYNIAQLGGISVNHKKEERIFFYLDIVQFILALTIFIVSAVIYCLGSDIGKKVFFVVNIASIVVIYFSISHFIDRFQIYLKVKKNKKCINY